MIKQGITLKSPSMIYVQSPMSAAPQPIGAPFFYQMGNRVATPYKGKREPVIKIFLDNCPESYFCFNSLFSKEIKPGLVSTDGGNPKYCMSSKAYKYCLNIIKRIRSKSYSANGTYNPDTMEAPQVSKSKVNNLLNGSWL